MIQILEEEEKLIKFCLSEEEVRRKRKQKEAFEKYWRGES